MWTYLCIKPQRVTVTKKMKGDMIVAVDFDGTLHCGQYPEIGIPAPYAVEKMKQLKESGHYLIINTCRCGDHLTAAINWLLEKGIPFDRVNDNHPDAVELHSSNSRKVFADVYVDDRQVGGLPTWPYTFDYIEEQAKQIEEKGKEALNE